MATVTVSWDLSSQSFPAGTQPGGFAVSISGGTLPTPLTMTADASPVVFPAVPEEAATDPAYLASVQRVDASGGPLGAPATASFSVLSPPPVLIDVPGVLGIVIT